MRRLFIPTIGTEYTLAKDWTFVVRNDERNVTIIKWIARNSAHKESLPVDHTWYPLGMLNHRAAPTTINATLPKGTILRVDRIYIRKGAKDFDSLTFYAPGIKTQHQTQMKSLRFFASLDDVNNMVVE